MAVNLSFIGGAGWQFFDNDGVPLAGGKIYTYAAGTTTPLATYTSRSGAVANANPIILDAAGRTPEQIWSTEGLLYKYVVADSNNVIIRTWDNIGGSVVASNLAQDLANTSDNAKGDALIGFKQSNASGFLTNAVARTVNNKLQERVSVEDFGAVGDGVTDDTTAIQNAINTLEANGGGYLYFQAKNYLVTSTLNLIDTSVILQGEGQYSTTITAGAAMAKVIYVATAFSGATSRPCGGVCGLYINGNNLADVGLHVSSVNEGIFHDLLVQDTLIGGILHDTTATGPSSQHNHFQNIRVGRAGSSYAIKIDGGAGNSNNSLNRYDNLFLLITNNDGMYFGFSDGNTVSHLRIYRAPGGTGRGVVFAADDTNTNRHARTHMIYNVQAGNSSGIYALAGTGVRPSGANYVQFNSGNAGSNIVIEAGATLGVTGLREGARGTFTPTIGGATVAGVQTYAAQLGSYTQVGDRILFSIYIELTAKDPATAGNLRIFGLPLAATNDPLVPRAVNAIGRYKLDLTAGYTLPSVITQASTTWLNLWQSGDNVDPITLTASALLSDSIIYMTGQYTVAD